MHSNGPYPSSLIRIESRNLTIRAAPGSTPRFVPDAIENGPGQFLSTTADLRLEGLDIDWPIPAPIVKQEEAGSKSVVQQSKGKLTLVACRVNCGPNGVCIGSGGQEMTITNYHLLAMSGMGICVGWKPSAAAVRIENTVLEGTVGIVLTQTPTVVQLPGRMVLLRNTVATERGVQIFPDIHLRQPMPVTAHGNIFDTNIVVAIFAFGNYRRAADTHAGMTAILRERITWTDDGNVYRHGCQFLTGNRPKQVLSIVPSAFKRMEQWLEFWTQSDSRSIEGIITFQTRADATDCTPLQLGKIDRPSGPIPVDVGADVSRLLPTPKAPVP